MTAEAKSRENKVDEMIDDASLLIGTTKSGVILSSKIAKEALLETKKYKIADKIGKLLKDLE